MMSSDHNIKEVATTESTPPLTTVTPLIADTTDTAIVNARPATGCTTVTNSPTTVTVLPKCVSLYAISNSISLTTEHPHVLCNNDTRVQPHNVHPRRSDYPITVSQSHQRPKPQLVKAIKDYVVAKRLTLRQAAQEIGTSASTLSKFMHGEERKRGWRKFERHLLAFLRQKGSSLVDGMSLTSFQRSPSCRVISSIFVTSKMHGQQTDLDTQQ